MYTVHTAHLYTHTTFSGQNNTLSNSWPPSVLFECRTKLSIFNCLFKKTDNPKFNPQNHKPGEPKSCHRAHHLGCETFGQLRHLSDGNLNFKKRNPSRAVGRGKPKIDKNKAKVFLAKWFSIQQGSHFFLLCWIFYFLFLFCG